MAALVLEVRLRETLRAPRATGSIRSIAVNTFGRACATSPYLLLFGSYATNLGSKPFVIATAIAKEITVMTSIAFLDPSPFWAIWVA
jgi:hypothetical protein